MSKRIVALQATNALQWRQANHSKSVMTRCFATSSSLQAYRTQEQKKRDANLRHAINLYHLTNFFFPTSATENSLDKDLDSHIRDSIMGNSTTISRGNNLDGKVDMKSIHPALAQKLKEDEDAFGSIFSNTFSNSEDSAANALGNAGRRSNATNMEQLPLPPLEDREAVERYIAETAKRNSAIGGLPDQRAADNLDVRGAQVRDALFGTVGGIKPGLEAVRERVKEREDKARREEQQGIQSN